MSDYIQTLQQIRDNMGRKRHYWTSEGVARLLRTGTDGVHDETKCRGFLSRLRCDPVHRKHWAKEIEAFETEVGTKLVPFKHTAKNASLFEDSEPDSIVVDIVSEIELDDATVDSIADAIVYNH